MTSLRYVLLGLALLIAAAVGWRSVGGLRPFAPAVVAGALPKEPVPLPPASAPPPPASNAKPSPADRMEAARARIVGLVDSVPEFTAFYRTLSTAFPRVYEGMIAREARSISAGEGEPSAGTLIWRTLRDLQQSDGILAAGAGEDDLARFFDSRLALLDALATSDQRGCADFVYGTVDPSIEEASLSHRDLVSDLAVKELAAIANGRRLRLARAPARTEDLDLVAEGLASRHLDADEIAMLLDGKSLVPPLPDTRVCDVGRTYLSVLKSLPTEVRQRIYGLTAQLLARS